MTKNKLVYWFIGLLVYILIFLEFFHPISAFTQDLGRHLKTGEIIWTTHHVPTTNLFSYTHPDFPFVNTHWLSEVVFYLLNTYLGTFGLLFVMSLVAATSFVLLIYFFSHTKYQILNTKYYFAILVTVLLYSGILLERTDLRPEIFSFLFMSIFVVILYKWREFSFSRHSGDNPPVGGKDSRIDSGRTAFARMTNTKYLIFLLPFLELFWVNMHIYFIIGPLLIGLFLLEQVIIVIARKVQGERVKGKGFFSSLFTLQTSPLLLVLVLTALATLLNPNGLTGALYPFTVFNNYGYTIAENQTLFFLINYGFRNASYLYFGIAVVVLFILLLTNRKQTHLIDWLLFIVFTYLACSATRNFPLFVFGTFVPFVNALSSFSLSERSESKGNKPSTSSGKNYFLFGTTFLFIGLFVYSFISTNGLGYSVTPGAEKGADFFIQNHLKGPMFNNFDIGSYLDYRLYPNQRVFVDGRPEAYPASFFQNTYIPMQQDTKIFEQVDKKYHFQSIYFSYTDQTPWARTFLQAIMLNPNWQLIYLDTSSAIWVKKDGINQNIAANYAVTQANFTLPQDSPRARVDADAGEAGPKLSVKDYFHLIYFFQLTDWNQQLIPVLQKIVEIDPNNCPALGALAQNPQTSLLYGNRYLNACR